MIIMIIHIVNTYSKNIIQKYNTYSKNKNEKFI